MPTPARTVLFLNKLNGKKALGANFLLFSQKGNTARHAAPIKNIANKLGSSQPFFAANVRGISNNEKAAHSKSNPKISSSNQRCFAVCQYVKPRKGGGGRRPRFAAFCWLVYSESASGRYAIGSTIAQIPYPHLQLNECSSLSASGEPSQTLTRNGSWGRVEHNARLARSLVSAMKIWIRICRPVLPAE
jgi:hypothetical protein